MQVKYFSLLVICWMTSFGLFAQSNCPKYTSAIQAGKAFLNKKTPDFDKALIEFQAAQIAARECGLEEKAGKVAAAEIKKVFEGLRKQRDRAIRNESRAKTAEKEAKEALIQVKAEQQKTEAAKQLAEQRAKEVEVALAVADSLNIKNEKLIDAFYFYEGKFALAYKNGKYGFINKEGDVVIDYQYEKAEQFDYTGFAKTRRKNTDYLIDTKGQEFQVSYQLNDINTHTEALDLRGLQFDSFPSKIITHTQLKIIILDGKLGKRKNIKNFPNNLDKLRKLEYLSCDYCSIRNLNKKIGQLSSLHTLSLKSNHLINLPPELGFLQALKTLLLSGNQINKLPPEISGLKALQSLNLYNNKLNSLVSEIGEIQTLKTLILGENKLNSLPASIGQMTSLQILYLSYNDLNSLPLEFGNLSNLRILYLNGNHLNNLSPEFLQLKNLLFLDLSSNEIINLPLGIKNLNKLKTLNLGANQLSNLPAEIGQLSSLVNLLLNDNQLNNLPSEITHLSNLQKLELSYNKLNTIPFEIGQLNSLQILGLSANKLIALPHKIKTLEELQILDLSANKLSSLPIDIGQLRKLQKLVLNNNPLNNLPPEIGLLSSLETLLVSNTLLKSVPLDLLKLNLKLDSWRNILNILIKNGNASQIIEIAINTLIKFPNKTEIYAYLALAYTLNNEYAKAEKIYLEWKNKTYKHFSFAPEVSFKKTFLQDITDLEAAGIHHPDFQKAKQLLQE